MRGAVALFLTLAACGCAPRYTYVNPSIPESQTAYAFGIDRGYCEMMQKQLAPPPIARTDSCPDQGVTYDCTGAAMAAAGTDAANAIALGRYQSETFQSCMASRGWLRQKIK